MAQWVKALADKLGRLGLILEIYLTKKHPEDEEA